MIPDTSLGLMSRLRQAQFDQEAWEDFLRRYHRVLLDWSRRWGVQQADAQDLAQEVLLQLVRQMREFEYDPSQSFRGWLKTVAFRTLSRQRKRTGRCLGVVCDGSVHARLVQSLEAREDLERELLRLADQELLQLAAEQVKRRVAPHTWQAFEMLAISGIGGKEIATRLGMTLSSVYVARHNVQKMLGEEVRRLGGDA